MINLFTIFKKYFYAAALVTGCCFIYSCENDQREIDEWSKDVTEVEEARGVESFLSQDGVMRAKLRAPLMYRVLGKDTIYVEFPKTLHVDFFNDSTKIESWLDCKYGKYYENQNKVYLRDSVVVININGDTLKCPDLWWDQNRQLFYTDKYAEYHARGKNIYGGRGLEATQDMSSVTFKEATGVTEVSEEGMVE